jgi:hypothetical protein
MSHSLNPFLFYLFLIAFVWTMCVCAQWDIAYSYATRCSLLTGVGASSMYTPGYEGEGVEILFFPIESQ